MATTFTASETTLTPAAYALLTEIALCWPADLFTVENATGTDYAKRAAFHELLLAETIDGFGSSGAYYLSDTGRAYLARH